MRPVLAILKISGEILTNGECIPILVGPTMILIVVIF